MEFSLFSFTDADERRRDGHIALRLTPKIDINHSGIFGMEKIHPTKTRRKIHEWNEREISPLCMCVCECDEGEIFRRHFSLNSSLGAAGPKIYLFKRFVKQSSNVVSQHTQNPFASNHPCDLNRRSIFKSHFLSDEARWRMKRKKYCVANKKKIMRETREKKNVFSSIEQSRKQFVNYSIRGLADNDTRTSFKYKFSYQRLLNIESFSHVATTIFYFFLGAQFRRWFMRFTLSVYYFHWYLCAWLH